MRITVHGEQLPIPFALARYATTRLNAALARRAGAVRGVVLRLVRPSLGGTPNWIAIVDLGSHGTVVTRVSALDAHAALADVAERTWASVEHRLSLPPRAPGRMTRIYA